MPPIPSPNATPPISILGPPNQSTPPPPASSNVSIVAVIVATVLASTTAVVLLLAAVAALVYFGGLLPSPSHPTTTDFVALGKAYGKQLGPSYAPAWKAYAADLRAGKPIADAGKNMGAVWADQRGKVYDKFITPELSKIVPDSTPNEQVTPAQRAALAAAADDLARGLGVPP